MARYRSVVLWLCIFAVLGGSAVAGQQQFFVQNRLQMPDTEESTAVKSLRIENYFVKGENVQRFSQVPERVVVVGENEIEAMLELGLEKSICMAIVTNSRKFNMKEKNAAKLPELPKRDRSYLNVEYITALHPDLIVAQQDKFVRTRLRDTDYWNERGIRTFVPFNANTPSKHMYPETIENEMLFLQGLGKIFRQEERSRRIVQETYDAIADIRQQSRSEKKPKVMFVEFLSSMISYDATKLAGNMAARIGAEVPVTSPVIGFEQLIQEDPDVLFVVCSHADYGACITKVTENPALQQLRCVSEQRVYSIPLRYTYAASVRTADGLRYMARCMYPACGF